VGSQVGSQVGNQVWNQVGDKVRSQVESQVRSQYEFFSSYGNVSDYNWLSFFDFFDRIGLVNIPYFTTFKNLIDSGVYDMIQLDGLCVVCELPTTIIRDKENRLHSGENAAIAWADGYELYFLNGMALEKELWKRIVNKQFTFKEITELKNMEHRMIAMKYMEPDKLLEGVNAECISHTTKNNQLYIIKGIFDQDAYFLRYECPSTARVYLKGIDPDYARANPDADDCQAWSHNMIKEEYLDLEFET
jgi:hypothetical protein